MREARAQSVVPNTSPAGGALVELAHEDGQLHVRAFYVNEGKRAGELQYRLRVRREGSSTSTSRQGGSFKTTPGRADTLSTVRIDGRPGDRLLVRLSILEEGEVVDSWGIDQPFPDW